MTDTEHRSTPLAQTDAAIERYDFITTIAAPSVAEEALEKAFSYLQTCPSGRALVEKLRHREYLKFALIDTYDPKDTRYADLAKFRRDNAPETPSYLKTSDVIYWNYELHQRIFNERGVEIGTRSPAIVLAELAAEAIAGPAQHDSPDAQTLSPTDRANKIAEELGELTVSPQDTREFFVNWKDPTAHTERAKVAVLGSVLAEDLKAVGTPMKSDADSLVTLAKARIGAVIDSGKAQFDRVFPSESTDTQDLPAGQCHPRAFTESLRKNPENSTITHRTDANCRYTQTVENTINGLATSMTYAKDPYYEDGRLEVVSVNKLYGVTPPDPAFALHVMKSLNMTPAIQLAPNNILHTYLMPTVDVRKNWDRPKPPLNQDFGRINLSPNGM